MIQQDFLRRLIEQLGQAVARIAGRRNQPEEVLDEVANAKALLPLVPGLLETSSVRTLVQLIGSTEVLRLLAELYRHEAEAHKQAGRTAEAARCLEERLQHAH